MERTVILAVDTSGRATAVAVVAGSGEVLAALRGTRPRGHGEDIAVLADRALAGRQPEHVVAGRGPGSFTGLRVGLAFAAVFAWARDLHVTGICSLDVVAEQDELRDGWVVMDARRGEVYSARFEDGRRLREPEVLTRAEALARTHGSAVAGDAALLAQKERRAAGTTVLDPAALGRCAHRAVVDGSAQPLTPLYLRRPDVTVPGGGSGRSAGAAWA